eukprot:g23775.t1
MVDLALSLSYKPSKMENSWCACGSLYRSILISLLPLALMAPTRWFGHMLCSRALQACSVLLLSLDGAAGSAVSGQRTESFDDETLRLKVGFRRPVSSKAWTLRSTTVAQRAEESIARVEEEVKKIWRELLSKERNNTSKEGGHVEARIVDDLKHRIEKTQSQITELHALKPENVDALMKKMIDEVSRSVKLLGDRCSKLEAPQILFVLDEFILLVQQRRQDLQHAQANFREVEARFNDLDQKEHLEDRHMKAMKAMQEGLSAVRAEVKKLSELVEVVQTQPGDQDGAFKSREVLALKAQVSDLQEQVTQLVVRGLEERFANLRADVSREVATVVRESKENWVVASRRLAALEAWPASQAELSASMHSLRSEHQEDRIVFGETIEKEDKQYKKIREEQRAKKKAQEEALGISVKRSMSVPKQKSCQVSQLEQSLGHFPNPHPHDGKPRLNADPQKILRFGVSAEGQGRGAYLKLERTKGGPIERYGRAMTTAQEIGWTAGPATKTYKSSPFAHRPLIESQFYRPMGVSFSTGALSQQWHPLAAFWKAEVSGPLLWGVGACWSPSVGGLFGGAEPKKIAVKSAAKMAVLATSKSPRSSRKKTPDSRKSADGQVARSITPREGSRSSTTPGFPAVIGPKLEWALPAKVLREVGAPGTNGVLTTGEMEVAGIFCRLKFFPDGSPLRQTDGSCSSRLTGDEV